MKTVAFSEFRRSASRLLDEVEDGEVVVILRNGRPVARLVEVREGVEEPRWKEPFTPIRPKAGKAVSLSRAVLEGRGDRA